MAPAKIRPNKPPADPFESELFRAIRGEPSVWGALGIDPAHPTTNDFHADYRAGDKQKLLWAIDDAAQRGEPVPAWAAQALHALMLGVAKGQFASWEDAFGKMFATRRHQRSLQSLALMFEIERRVRERPKGMSQTAVLDKIEADRICSKGKAHELLKLAQKALDIQRRIQIQGTIPE